MTLKVTDNQYGRLS